MIRRARVLFVFVPILLAACAALSGKHPTFAVYAPQLTAAPAATAATPVAWQLLIETPVASAALDSTHITVTPSPGVLEVYPAARWRDPAPDLLRSLIVQSFEDSGRILGISGAASGFSGDFTLATELRDFQIEIDGANAIAALRFNAKLLDRRSNRIVATRRFALTAPAQATDAASAFAALQAVVNEAMPQLVAWTLEQGELQAGKR